MGVRVISGASNRVFICLREARRVVVYERSPWHARKYAEILKWLRAWIPVPRVFGLDKNVIELEYVPGSSLLSWRQRRGFAPQLLAAYKRVIKHISPLYEVDVHRWEKKLLSLHIAPFRLRTVRWEHQYFLANFVEGLHGGRFVWPAWRWILELEPVAHSCFNFICKHPTLIHRDLQSTNVLLRGGLRGRPVFIDLQDVMVANALYDVASLLEDPYVRPMPAWQQALLDTALPYLSSLLNEPLTTLARLYKYFAVQRLVQAHGAFARLTRFKNLDFFKTVLYHFSRIGRIMELLREI